MGEMTIVLNHDDVVREAAAALAGCEPLRLMMERVTGIANKRLVTQDGEGDGDVLSVIDVVSSLVIESMIEVAAEDTETGNETQIFVSAYGKSNDIGLQRLAEFFNLLTGELEQALARTGDGGEAFIEWLVNEGEYGGVR